MYGLEQVVPAPKKAPDVKHGRHHLYDPSFALPTLRWPRLSFSLGYFRMQV